MNHDQSTQFNRQTLIRVLGLLLLLTLPLDAWARVGGGHSYSGGGGSGGGGGGGGILGLLWLIFQLLRFLVYLTIEYPIVGIPLDLILIAGGVYFFVIRKPAPPGQT